MPTAALLLVHLVGYLSKLLQDAAYSMTVGDLVDEAHLGGTASHSAAAGWGD